MTSKKIKMAPRPALRYNPPMCPKHGSGMRFDKSDSVWRCVHTECRVVARRKDDNYDTDQEQHTPTATTLEIVTNQDGEESYRLSFYKGGSYTTVDVSDHVDMVIDEQTNSVTLCLLFHDVKRIYL